MAVRREVKSVTIEFMDGDVETHQEPGMFYKYADNYPGGAFPRPEDKFITHEIHWVVK